MGKPKPSRPAAVRHPRGKPRASPEDKGRIPQRRRKRPEPDPEIKAIRALHPAFDRLAALVMGLAGHRRIAALVAIGRGSATAAAIAKALRVPRDEAEPLVLALLEAGVIVKVKAGLALADAVSVEEEPDLIKVAVDRGEGCSIAVSVPWQLLGL